MVDWFYEHVNLHRAEGRELRPGEEPTDTVIQFRPDYGRAMMVACLFAHWRARNDPSAEQPILNGSEHPFYEPRPVAA